MRFGPMTRLLLGGALLLATADLAAAQPSTNLDDYVLFATQKLKTKGLTVNDGDVGVNEADGRLLAPRFFTAPNSIVASDRVRFDKNQANTVLQQLYANVVERYGPLPTAFTPPIIADVKAACGFPNPFPSCNSTAPVDVSVGSTTVLPPGAYGKVRVHGTALSSASLVLSGGTYTFCDLKVGRSSEVRAQNAATINIVGKAALAPSTFLGPDLGSGLAASDIQLYSSGSLVKFTRGSTTELHVCAPDAKMRLTQGGTHTGVYVARFIRTQEITVDVGSPGGAFLDSSRP